MVCPGGGVMAIFIKWSLRLIKDILLGDDSEDPSADKSMLITSKFFLLATLCKLLLLLLVLIFKLLLLIFKLLLLPLGRMLVLLSVGLGILLKLLEPFGLTTGGLAKNLVV